MSLQDKNNSVNLCSDSFTVTNDLKGVLDALPFYVMLIDEDHKIIFANTEVQRKFGRDETEIAGTFCPKSIHGTDKPILECPLEESIATGKHATREIYDSEHDMWLSSDVYPTEMKTVQGRKIYFHMIEDISKTVKAEEKLRINIEKQKRITNSGIVALGKIVESRDPYTAHHQAKVSKIAYAIAKEIGLSDKASSLILTAGMLHDVGKVSIPIEILLKPRQLTYYEFEVVKNHPQAGYDILKDIEFDSSIAEMVLQHHERIDGSGYPRGLIGDEILFGAKILNVSDVMDAMTSHRPYRPKRSIEETLEEIVKNTGTFYDSQVAQVAVHLCRKKIILNDEEQV